MGKKEETVHEAYSFACMRCGHGWEQEYEITRLVYPDGTPSVAYRSGGKVVPSPLTHPTCGHCEGHLVRILAAGRVSAATAAMTYESPGQVPSARRRR